MNNALTLLDSGFPGLILALVAMALGVMQMLVQRKQVRSLRRQQQTMGEIKCEQDQSLQADQSLRQVVRRHLKQSLRLRADLDRLRAAVRNHDFQLAQRSDCGQAINRIRSGRSLDPLLRQGQINTAEAHLIKLVHVKHKQL